MPDKQAWTITTPIHLFQDPAKIIRFFLYCLIIFIFLFIIKSASYLLFHSLVETFSIVIFVIIFILVWNSRDILDNNYLLFLGEAYLFVGLLDLLHMLAYKGMGVFPDYGPNLPTQLWIVARYLESLSLLLAPFFLARKRRPILWLVGLALIIGTLLLTIFYEGIFPVCFIEGRGLTPFKIASEYVIALILSGSLVLLVRRRRAFDPYVLELLAISIVVTILSELCFTLYTNVYGLPNMIGHLFKVISSYLIYKAIVETGLTKPFRLLFRSLKESEELFKTLADSNIAGVFLYQEKILYMNPVMESLTGYSREELLRMSPERLIHSDYQEMVNQAVGRRLRGEKFSLQLNDLKIVTKQGETRWVQCRTETINYGGGFAGLVNLVDITVSRDLEIKLRQAATTDKLTGIFNRLMFDEVIHKEIEKSKRYQTLLFLIMFDIDDFKRINDTYGHHMGDFVLQRLANIVQNNIRLSDWFGRWGGEEFIILCNEGNPDGIELFAEKLRTQIEGYSFADIGRVTCSFGLTQMRETDSLDSLIQRADAAMYRAKEKGRNRVESAL